MDDEYAWLRAELAKRHITRWQLAYVAQLSYSYVSRLLNGEQRAGGTAYNKIKIACVAFGIEYPA